WSVSTDQSRNSCSGGSGDRYTGVSYTGIRADQSLHRRVVRLSASASPLRQSLLAQPPTPWRLISCALLAPRLGRNNLKIRLHHPRHEIGKGSFRLPP